jgi:hypothetical protein
MIAPMSSTIDAAVRKMRSSTGTRLPSITISATANAVSVAIGTPQPWLLARRKHQRVERCRHRHPADRGRHGKRRRARLREPPDRELALDLEPHQQEEDREERIVDPVPQRHPERCVRKLDAERRFPERGEFGAQR